MKKLLWIGDACCDSGFSRATHMTLETLRHRYDVSVLGLNYRGDPHEYPYHIYPVYPGGDSFGVGRLVDVCKIERPDVLIIQNDPWNIPFYMDVLQYAKKTPVVGIIAVDGLNCRGGDASVMLDEGSVVLTEKQVKARGLNMLSSCVFWTQFGLDQAREGGYAGPAYVVPLGVDLGVYRPMDKTQAREECELSLPQDAWIVGYCGRNQPRKRIDLAMFHFAEWVSEYDVDDAYMFLHVAPTGEQAFELKQLIGYIARVYPKAKGRFLVSEPEAFKGLDEETLRKLYCCFDVGINVSQGEGMNLPALEMMACGVPQILAGCGAHLDWPRSAARLVKCSSFACTPNSINVVGGVVDKYDFIDALQEVYVGISLHERMREAGLRLAADPRYRWENIGNAVGDALDRTLSVHTVEFSGVA